jgi:hypothetical protein
MTDCTPGMLRTARSALARTCSQVRTCAASTVIEKKTLPSPAMISDNVPVAGSGRPSGAAIAASFARTSSLSDAMPGLHGSRQFR